jgi:D-lactate dehydrogenase
MKKGVVIINTSRGGIIKSDAILSGLNSGKISYFATDVLEEEDDFIDAEHIFNAMEHEKCAKLILENQLLINHPRVIVTPHVAFYTKEAISRIINQTIMNITSFKEEKIINKIN